MGNKPLAKSTKIERLTCYENLMENLYPCHSCHTSFPKKALCVNEQCIRNISRRSIGGCRCGMIDVKDFYTCRYCVLDNNKIICKNDVIHKKHVEACEKCGLVLQQAYLHASTDERGKSCIVCWDCTLTCSKCGKKNCDYEQSSFFKKNKVFICEDCRI
jgi:hypothetical protein